MMGKYQDIDINNEKVKKIVNAAFEEFAKYGTDKASLNKILKSSAISKNLSSNVIFNRSRVWNSMC